MTKDVVVAILALVIGALLVLRGYPTMRLTISLFGAFVGFVLGATLVASQTGTSYLADIRGWIGAVLAGLVLGALAFTFYRVGVTVGLAALGYAMTTLLLAGLGVTTGWLVHGTGLLVAVVLVMLAIVVDLPGMVIVLATSLAGAELAVFGVRLLTKNLVLAELSVRDPQVGLTGFWWVLAIGLALLGLFVQYRYLVIAHRSSRAQWVSR
ncbi:protein of unknown function [Propionibacterium cyclohexanicum]|uniref:TM7S3/TM198-like domain-containing protein n=1 Tax=Propionibacterium cyclohexanicum TaxID=64702 RepID=A0A1H9SF84_9ACTN|nr:DUF4203 domain-containing protein [Propionibacterium cyclohexanicum]SER83631.1 protein of unknown function [Propionibacterium cyclohexanicum]